MNRETIRFVRRTKFQRLTTAARPIRTNRTIPARTPGVSPALMASRTTPAKRIARQASPNSNLRLKSILLHTSIKRASAEAELRGGERNVEMMHAQRALDHLSFEFVEVERLTRGGDGRAR